MLASVRESHSLLLTYIENRLSRESPFFGEELESKSRAIARKALKIVAALFSVLGNIPFIPDGVKCGGGNIAWGSVIAFSDTVTYSIFTYWILDRLIDLYLGKRGHEEEVHQRIVRMSPCGQAATFAISLAVGGLLQVPIAWFYANVNHSPIVGVSAAFTGLLIPFISSYEMASRMSRRKEEGVVVKALDKMRGEMVRHIENNLEIVSGCDADKRGQILDNLRRLSGGKERVFEMLQEGKLILKSSNGARSVASIIFIIQMIVLGTLSYQGMMGMTKNSAGSIVALVLGVGASGYLYGKAIFGMTQRAWRVFKNAVCCRFGWSASESLSPKLSFALKGLGLVLVVLSYPTSEQMTDTFASLGEGLHTTISLSFCLGMALLVSRSVLDVIDQVIREKITQFGTSEARELLQVSERLRRLAKMLRESRLLDLAYFLKAVPQEVFDHLRDGVNLRIEELDEYISEHPDRINRSLLAINS